MNRIRLAMAGASPCGRCAARCCKQNGHDYAVLLRGAEVRRFAAWAADVPIRDGQRTVVERVLMYRQGKCPFLGDDDLCTIYEDRPAACREFECVKDFNRHGLGRHGRFLELNRDVHRLLESM